MPNPPLPGDLSINPELVTEILVRFIRNEITRTGFRRAVFGLSGGLDSSVVAYLAARAMGPDNVLAVTMPYKTSSGATRDDSQTVIEALGVRSLNVVHWLRRNGVENCQSMMGGIERWSLEIDTSVPRY